MRHYVENPARLRQRLQQFMQRECCSNCFQNIWSVFTIQRTGSGSGIGSGSDPDPIPILILIPIPAFFRSKNLGSIPGLIPILGSVLGF